MSKGTSSVSISFSTNTGMFNETDSCGEITSLGVDTSVSTDTAMFNETDSCGGITSLGVDTSVSTNIGVLNCETENEIRKINTMSLCMALAFNDKLYIASDSKSSVCIGKSSFENRAKYSATASLCYKKIFMVDLSETAPVIGFSVGDNVFEYKNLNVFINSLNFSGCSDIKDVAEVIKNSMNLNINLVNVNSIFTLFRFENDEFREIVIEKKEKTYEYRIEKIQPRQGGVIKFVSGAEWAKELSNYMSVTIPEVDESTMHEINRVYDNAKTIGPYFDDSVGGPIHIGKLTSEGFDWLQNGYEL